MTEELKPCPFCGNNDVHQSSVTGGIFCEDCGCNGPWSPAFEGNWNTRALPAVTAPQGVPTEGMEILAHLVRPRLQALLDDMEDWIERAPAALAPAQPAPDAWDELVAEAITEAEKAMRKFPQPNYVISKVAEEAGEVVKAAIHAAEGRETMENLRGEMKQTIAMLYRLWVEGDQVHGLPPVAGVKECRA